MKVSFIGFGTISNQIYDLVKQKALDLEFIGIYDPYVTEEKKNEIKDTMSIYENVEEIINAGPDFVIEAANSIVGKEMIPKLLEAGVDVIALSTGAFVDGELIDKLDDYEGKLYLSGGALPCADMIRSNVVGEVDEVTVITTKPPKGLKGAAGFDIDVDNITEKVKIFEGTAREAIELFPKNVNVVITLSLAGVGVDRTKAVIYTDPSVENNIHEVVISGEAGDYYIKASGTPSANPKTSKITAFSVVSLLEKLISNLKIG